MLVPALYQDPFAPILFSSPALVVTDEQKMYVRKVLSISSSDEQFADKAYRAITHILTGGSVTVPAVTSISPGSATIGDPSFTLHVHGTGFTSASQIVWNGSAEPTIYVSATELTTEVDMSTATTATSIPVSVLNENGVLSNAQIFVLQPSAPVVLSSSTSKEMKESLKPPVTNVVHKK